MKNEDNNKYLLQPKDFPLGFFNETPEIELPEFSEFPAKSVFNLDIKEYSAPKLKDNLFSTKNIYKSHREEDEKLDDDLFKIYDVESEESQVNISSNLEEDIKKYKLNQDQEALARIIKELEPIIERGIQIFGNGNQNLRGHAKILVKNAIDSYDPSKGDLKTYVLLHLQRLRRLQPQAGNIITVSEGMKILAMQLKEAEKELTDKFGRPPSDQELADYMNISLSKLKKIREAQGSIAESSVEGMAVESAETEEDKAKARELWIQAIYIDLDPIEQYILDSVYGRNGRQKKTLQQIADELNLPLSTVHAKLKKIENIINMIENVY